MKSITYFASDENMGDTSPEDCALYRDWARSELRKEYPDHRIEVSDDPSLQQVTTDDEDNQEEIEEFCYRLWERCTWDWV